MSDNHRILPRFYAHLQEADRARQIARIVRESGETPTAPPTVAQATLPGDPDRLRGVPVIARGVGGTSPGSNPIAETLARERARDRRRS